MQVDLSRTFTLIKQHIELLEHVKKTMGVSESEANQIIYDHAIDSDRNLAAYALDKERRMKKLELTMLESRISAARNAAQPRPACAPFRPEQRKKWSGVRTLADMSPEEIIDNYKDDLDKHTTSARIAEKRIRDVIGAHPELLDMLPEDKREAFEPGGER